MENDIKTGCDGKTTLADKLTRIKLETNNEEEKEIIDILLSGDLYPVIIGLYINKHSNLSAMTVSNIFKNHGFEKSRG